MHFCNPQLTAPPSLPNEQTKLNFPSPPPGPQSRIRNQILSQKPDPFSHGSAHHIHLPQGLFCPRTFPCMAVHSNCFEEEKHFNQPHQVFKEAGPHSAVHLPSAEVGIFPALFPCEWRHVYSRGEEEFGCVTTFRVQFTHSFRLENTFKVIESNH